MPGTVSGQTVEVGGPPEASSDDEIVARVRAGERELFEVLVRRYSQRLFRAARAVVQDDVQAEDAVEAAFVSAYRHLDHFAWFSPWLTRIAMDEALEQIQELELIEWASKELGHNLDSPTPRDVHVEGTSPERAAEGRGPAGIVEAAIDALHEDFRVVFMLHVVEEMSVRETARCLQIAEDMVKTRLSVAHGLLQERLPAHIEVTLREVHPFRGARCDRMVERVLPQLPKYDEPIW